MATLSTFNSMHQMKHTTFFEPQLSWPDMDLRTAYGNMFVTNAYVKPFALLTKPKESLTTWWNYFQPNTKQAKGNLERCSSVFQGVEALFARRQTLQTLPSNPSAGLSKATLAATRPSHLFLRAFKTAACPPSNPSNPPAGLSKATLAATRPSHLFFRALKLSLPAVKRFKPFLQTLPQAFPRQPSQLHAPAICF